MINDRELNDYRHQAKQNHLLSLKYDKDAERGISDECRRKSKELASQHRRQRDLANSFAVARLMTMNITTAMGRDYLDLHGFQVQEVSGCVDMFLDERIDKLRQQVGSRQTVSIITGRGKNSRDGVPKVKPTTQRRLDERLLWHEEENSGCIEVYLESGSLLSTELGTLQS